MYICTYVVTALNLRWEFIKVKKVRSQNLFVFGRKRVFFLFFSFIEPSLSTHLAAEDGTVLAN